MAVTSRKTCMLISVLKVFRTCCLFLRLFGGLPYKWKTRGSLENASQEGRKSFPASKSKSTSAASKSKSTPAASKSKSTPAARFPRALRRSSCLVLWSWASIMNLMCHFTISQAFYNVKIYNGKQLIITMPIRAAVLWVTNVSSFILEMFLLIHLLLRSPLLARLIHQVNLVLDHIPPHLHNFSVSKLFFAAFVIFNVCLFLQCRFIIWKTTELFNELSQVESLFKFVTTISDVYYFTVHVIIQSLLVNRILIFYLLALIMSYGFISILPANILGLPGDNSLNLDDNTLTVVQVHSSLSAVVDQHRDEAEVYWTRRRLTTRDLDEALCLTRQLHDCQRSLNSYFTVPVTFIMVCSLVSITTMFFILLTSATMTQNDLVYCICDLLRNIVLVMALCCAPERVTEERDNLLNRILDLRTMTAGGAGDKKLGRLLDLMEAFPHFNMGGLYVISKARLAGIASFISTYVVILLQFKQTDEDNNTVTTNHSTTVLHH